MLSYPRDLEVFWSEKTRMNSSLRIMERNHNANEMHSSKKENNQLLKFETWLGVLDHWINIVRPALSHKLITSNTVIHN